MSLLQPILVGMILAGAGMLLALGRRRWKESTLWLAALVAMATVGVPLLQSWNRAMLKVDADYRAKQAAAATTVPTDPDEFMPEMADRAVRYAAERGKALDYTPDSVKAVEALLGELHEARVKQQLGDRDVNVQALHFGAYVGEVIRRRYGGSWATDHPAAGPKSFPIHWNGGESFPIGWCGKRILNGDEDNVWVKFRVVTSDESQRGATTQAGHGRTRSRGTRPSDERHERPRHTRFCKPRLNETGALVAEEPLPRSAVV